MTKKEKIFIEAYYPAFKSFYGVTKTDLIKIYKEDTYPGYPTTPGGSAWESELKALYCAIRLSKPNEILEIGNYQGASTNHILLAVEKNGFGNVTLLDIKEQLIYKDLHNENFNRVVSDSIEYLKNVKYNYDFIAQDGCHEYLHVKKELQLLKEKNKTNFYIWSHDYYADIKPTINVKRAWDEEGHGFNWFPLKEEASNCGIVIAKKI